MDPVGTVRRKLSRDGVSRTLIAVLVEIVGRRTLDWAGIYVRTVGAEVVLHGVRLDLDDDRIDDEVRTGMLTGGYESEERWLADRFVAPDTPTVELGSGTGYLSCYLADLMREDSRWWSSKQTPT